MLDTISNQVIQILSLSVGGVSILSVIASVVYVIKQGIALKKSNSVTEKQIEKAFKDAVLPKNIKIDLSNKIQEPIELGFTKIQLYLQQNIEKMERGEQLILKILHEFTHVNKLPESIQKEIEDYIEDSKSETIEV